MVLEKDEAYNETWPSKHVLWIKLYKPDLAQLGDVTGFDFDRKRLNLYAVVVSRPL